MDVKRSRPSQGSAKIKEKDAIMGTNNNSIVSKRSVERLYYPEPHFFRYFVKKPQRRSPLINRGYWLRMRAVDNVVQRFLEEPPADRKRKLVINLGCGHDPLPFQCLSKANPLCEGVLFIDVDYPELVKRKIEVLQQTPQLLELVGPSEHCCSLPDGVAFSSRKYLALGCDLADTPRLDDLLRRTCDFSRCMVLCTSEVALTYMDVEAADSLISWAASHNDIRLCLLEQFLPDGATHPFAKKMIQHFGHLHTPLKSIVKYPTLNDQKRRFQQYRWSSVNVESLWDIWCDPSQLPAHKRSDLDKVEPFDEWEEFMLFASHYFLLVARNIANEGMVQADGHIRLIETRPADHDTAIQRTKSPIFCTLPNQISGPAPSPRRFGALFALDDFAAFYGGIGERSRTKSTEVYQLKIRSRAVDDNHKRADSPSLILPSILSARACHAVATSADDKCLLVGGRASPDCPMNDCWYFTGHWRRVQDLPLPLFRHCVTWVDIQGSGGPEPTVLLYGGKTSNGTISPRWLVWQESAGWQVVKVQGTAPEPTFGAAIVATTAGRGILLGGMAGYGTLQPALWEWDLRHSESGFIIAIRKGQMEPTETGRSIPRMGAQLLSLSAGLLLIGGVGNKTHREELDVVQLKIPKQVDGLWSAIAIDRQADVDRPLLVGHSAMNIDDCILVAGGGAVCFSFGTFWNRAPFLLTTRADQNKRTLRVMDSASMLFNQCSRSDAPPVSGVCGLSEPHRRVNPLSTALGPSPRKAEITHLSLSSKDAFSQVMTEGKPIVLCGIDIGSCRHEWTLEKLKEKVGADREIVVHQANSRQMDFLRKSFAYSKTRFGTFIDEIDRGSQQYLRSLAALNPSKQAANLAADFPVLAADFTLPPELEHVTQNMHSSVLRISGPVNMWLHYDVMANILCQVIGIKRLMLYPPFDVSCFAIPPGASSSPVAVFEENIIERHPLLASAHPHEVVLHPGDILYIPPCWLHAASPLDNVSVSVNVFFWNLAGVYAPGKDVYGNRDVQAYEKGRRDIQRIAKSVNKLPPDMARFYLERLSDELRDKARQT